MDGSVDPDDPADLGGTTGWGRVVAPGDVEPEPPFARPWEGRAFALTALTMGRISGRNLDAFRHALSRLDRTRYLDDGYYGRWLHAAELMLVDSGVLASGAVEARARRTRGEDVPEPADPPLAKPDYAPTAPGSLRTVDAAPHFAPGDPVRARREPPDVAPPAPSAGPVGRGPCKLPRYLRGAPGAVTAVRPAHVLPDTHAVFAGEHPQHVYNVAFAAPDVWGPGAEPDVIVHADLFESYLEPR